MSNVAELYHYGIPGQKRGIRRFQYKDGSLTPAGKIRYAKPSLGFRRYKKLDGTLTPAGRQRMVEAASQSVYKSVTAPEKRSNFSRREKEKSGIRQIDINSDEIKKGSVLNRVANSGEAIDSRRKYVSLTNYDKKMYTDYFYTLGMDKHAPISEYTYTAKKKIKVATGEKVAEHIISKYGDQKIKDFASDLKLIEDKVSSKSSTKDGRWLYQYSTEARRKVDKYVRKYMDAHVDEIVEDFKNSKYDAIIDVNDYINLAADYPVVLIDPSKSISLKKETEWNRKKSKWF